MDAAAQQTCKLAMLCLQVADTVFERCAGPEVFFCAVSADVREVQRAISTHVNALAQALADTVTSELLTKCRELSQNCSALNARVHKPPQLVAELVSLTAFLDESEADATTAQRLTDVSDAVALYSQLEQSDVQIDARCVAAFWDARARVPQLQVR